MITPIMSILLLVQEAYGHTHPGAMVPHGMIQPGPDTRIDGWDSCSGYYYEDTTINGFAHTRLSGTGCADFGDFLLMPTVGVQRTDFLGTESQKRPFASAFSHEKEYAEPGYYSVFLDTYGVKAELTSTERAAMHRYTFPESKESGFILDMDYNIQQQINQVMEVEAVNDTVLRGRKRSAYWAYRQDLYFYAVFSKPFTYTLYTDTVQENDKQIPVCKMLLHLKRRKMNKCWLSSLSLLLMRKVLIRTSRLRCPVGILMECVPMLRRNGMNACQRLQSKPMMKTSVPFSIRLCIMLS